MESVEIVSNMLVCFSVCPFACLFLSLGSPLSQFQVDIYSMSVILWEIFRKERMTLVFIGAGATSIEKYEELVCEGFRAPIPEKWPEGLSKTRRQRYQTESN